MLDSDLAELYGVETRVLLQSVKRNITRFPLIQKGIPPRHILYLPLDFFTSRRELRNAVTYFLDLTGERPIRG